MASKRTAVRGSCHCGFVRFIAFLDLPHQQAPPDAPRQRQKIYRCNCTICHKLGHFHIRPKTQSEDFILLSPLDPFTELGIYQFNEKRNHFIFCKTCSVTPFLTSDAHGEVVEVRLSELGVPGVEADDKPIKVWRPTGANQYLSINGQAIEARQPGFDMREMRESKSLSYIDCLNEGEDCEKPSYERPCIGGCY